MSERPAGVRPIGAPGGTMTSVRAGASNDVSPLVNRTVPATT